MNQVKVQNSNLCVCSVHICCFGIFTLTLYTWACIHIQTQKHRTHDKYCHQQDLMDTNEAFETIIEGSRVSINPTTNLTRLCPEDGSGKNRPIYQTCQTSAMSLHLTTIVLTLATFSNSAERSCLTRIDVYKRASSVVNNNRVKSFAPHGTTALELNPDNTDAAKSFMEGMLGTTNPWVSELGSKFSNLLAKEKYSLNSRHKRAWSVLYKYTKHLYMRRSISINQKIENGFFWEPITCRIYMVVFVLKHILYVTGGSIPAANLVSTRLPRRPTH